MENYRIKPKMIEQYFVINQHFDGRIQEIANDYYIVKERNGDNYRIDSFIFNKFFEKVE